jgi:molybdenum cofactor synthesis domain-containing protein
VQAFVAASERIAVAQTDSDQPHALCAVAPIGVLSDVTAAIEAGTFSVIQVWKAHGIVPVPIADASRLVDLDGPEDFQRWQQTRAARRTMIGPDEALQLVVNAASVRPTRQIPLEEAWGRCLAEEVVADRAYPPFARAMMDGFAVRVEDAGRSVEVVGQLPAGCTCDRELRPGQCLEIMTGAPCPPSVEAVVPKEVVERSGACVALPEEVARGANIAGVGSECGQGQRVLAPGDILTPLAIAVLASFGCTTVCVVPRPRLGVITTGAELIPAGQELQSGQIRDSNGPMLLAMIGELGCERPRYLHAADSREAICAALTQMADRDIVLLSGGVSVGTYDLVPDALAQYGAEVVFHKVRQKPGKPLLVAQKGDQLLFGLPGNPLACHLGFHRYVAAAVRKMEGKPALARPLFGELAAPIAAKGGRTHFVPARARYAPDASGGWHLEVLPGVSSADIFTGCHANCYVEVRPGERPVEAGASLPFTWFDAAGGMYD